VGSDKNLIIKAEKIPRIGDKAVNEHLKPVGTVFDIFGPVSSPYISVKTEVKEPHDLVGKVLYASPQSNIIGKEEK
jgi:rRNA processing protein Gar1